MTTRRYVPIILGLWLLTAVGQASVGPVAEVKVAGGRVRIQATATSISEVLDRLSHLTGMKIVYEGAPPTDRLTAAIDAGSETEALSRLFEGLGLTYAFKLDAAGHHVETLFVTNAASRRASGGSTGTSTGGSAHMSSPAVENDEPEPLPVEGQDPINDPATMAPATDPGNNMTTNNPGYSASGYAGGGGQVGVVPPVEEQNPAFPGAASFPSPGGPLPGNPAFPSFPGPASYP